MVSTVRVIALLWHTLWVPSLVIWWYWAVLLAQMLFVNAPMPVLSSGSPYPERGVLNVSYLHL